jgi:hypothetical protein
MLKRSTKSFKSDKSKKRDIGTDVGIRYDVIGYIGRRFLEILEIVGNF